MIFQEDNKIFERVSDGVGTKAPSWGALKRHTIGREGKPDEIWSFYIDRLDHKIGPQESVDVRIRHTTPFPTSKSLEFDGYTVKLGPLEYCQVGRIRISHADYPRQAKNRVEIE